MRRWGLHERYATAVFSTVVLILAVLGAANATRSMAAVFTPDAIVSDYNFVASSSMSAIQIQAYLDSQPGVLKSSTFTDYTGSSKSAAQIIADAAVSTGVSPKVLLTKLQCEQQLLSDSTPSQRQLDGAMGLGMYDGGHIDLDYQGFGKQVRYGATTLRNRKSEWIPGVLLSIDGASVRPVNGSTYALYRYTPHFAGAELFWSVYSQRFGDPLSGGITAFVRNPSFESWSGSSLSDWTYFTNSGGALQRRTDWKRSGTSGGGLTNPSKDPVKVTDLIQAVTVVPGKTYKLSAWAVTDRVPKGVQLHLQFVNANGAPLYTPWTSGDQWGVGGGSMKQMMVTGTAPAGSVKANLYLRLAGGTHVNGTTAGSVVFDDVTLTSGYYATRNSSFENWSGSDPLDWGFDATGGGVLQHRTDWKRTGGSGVGLVNPSRDPAKASDCIQDVLVEPGKTYKFSAWAVSDRVPSGVQLHLQFLNADGKPLVAPWTSGDKWGVGGGSMKQMVVTGTAPAGSVRARLYLRLAGGSHLNGTTAGSVVFDDVLLVQPISTSVALSTSAATVTYAGGAMLSGTLRDTAPLSGTAVVEYTYDQSQWTAAATTSCPSGTFSVTVKPTRTTYYRARFGGDATHLGSSSPIVKVAAKAYLTAPTAPSTAYRGRSFTSAGYIKPRHTAGTYPVKIYCYRYERQSGGTYKWVLRKTASAKAANYSSYTKYAGSLALPYTGRWRLRAYHAADSSNAATYSGWRYLTVR